MVTLRWGWGGDFLWSRVGWLGSMSGGGGSLRPLCRSARIWHSRAPRLTASTSWLCGFGVRRRSRWYRRRGSGCACGQCAPVRRGPGGRRRCTCRVWWAWLWLCVGMAGSVPWMRSSSGWGDLVLGVGCGLGVCPVVGWVWPCLVPVPDVGWGVVVDACRHY